MTTAGRRLISRRDFTRSLLAFAAATGVSLPATAFLEGLVRLSHAGETFPEAKFFERLSDGRVRCTNCPHRCVLPEGGLSLCRTRKNAGGTLRTLCFENPCVLGLDPVEKGPLYHFRPGTTALALGTAGCNLHCRYCQNWQISQKSPAQTQNMRLTNTEAAARARLERCGAITFTYTEPAVIPAYVHALSDLAHENSLSVHVVTGAYLNPGPARELASRTDAFSAALKGFDETFYREVVGGELRHVLSALEIFRSSGAWMEIVTLLIPTLNDDDAQIQRLSKWVCQNLGADVPLHFVRFAPAYRLRNLPRMPVRTLERARQIATAQGLRHVYLGNLPGHDGNNTHCPWCGETVISRVGFEIVRSSVKDGKCPRCGAPFPGVWA